MQIPDNPPNQNNSHLYLIASEKQKIVLTEHWTPRDLKGSSHLTCRRHLISDSRGTDYEALDFLVSYVGTFYCRFMHSYYKHMGIVPFLVFYKPFQKRLSYSEFYRPKWCLSSFVNLLGIIHSFNILSTTPTFEVIIQYPTLVQESSLWSFWNCVYFFTEGLASSLVFNGRQVLWFVFKTSGDYQRTLAPELNPRRLSLSSTPNR